MYHVHYMTICVYIYILTTSYRYVICMLVAELSIISDKNIDSSAFQESECHVSLLRGKVPGESTLQKARTYGATNPSNSIGLSVGLSMFHTAVPATDWIAGCVLADVLQRATGQV